MIAERKNSAIFICYLLPFRDITNLLLTLCRRVGNLVGEGRGNMITKPCARCRKLIPYGKRYCDTCAPIVAAETEEQKKRANRRYNKSRDKKLEQFYNGKRWRITSKKYLDRHPKCIWCGEIATEVDHIEEINTPSGWARRYDETNFRPFCTTCHNKRHRRFTRKQTTRGV